MSTNSKPTANERNATMSNQTPSGYKTSSSSQQPKMGRESLQTPAQSTTKSPQIPAQTNTPTTTRITVRHNAGFGNVLYLRGDGAGLSWERGVPMRNIDANTWLWETDRSSFNRCSFKVLLNDQQYENGDNHTLACHSQMEYTPRF